MVSSKNQVIRLMDRRNLGYAEYGPAIGKPVIAFHGAPGSRLEHICDSSYLHASDLRLIIVDRPGYGLSDFQQNRTLLDWPNDIIQLADALKLDHFAVIGFSAGGAYATACAFKIPERLTRVALLSSMAPFDALGVTDNMLPTNRALFELAASDYQQVAQQLSVVAKTPEVVMNILEEPAPEPDKAIFADENFRRMYIANLSEALRQGLTGLAYDMSLIAQPWGFDPSAIKTRVSLWHGAQDINAPIAMGHHLAQLITQCQTHFFPDEGHLLTVNHWQEILEELSSD